jgi:hypothetical protein
MLNLLFFVTLIFLVGLISRYQNKPVIFVRCSECPNE